MRTAIDTFHKQNAINTFHRASSQKYHDEALQALVVSQPTEYHTHTHRKCRERRLGPIALRRALCPAVAVDTHTEVGCRLLRGVCSILVLSHGVVAICGIQRASALLLSPLLVRARKGLALLLLPQLAFPLDAFACNQRRLSSPTLSPTDPVPRGLLTL